MAVAQTVDGAHQRQSLGYDEEQASGDRTETENVFGPWLLRILP